MKRSANYEGAQYKKIIMSNHSKEQYCFFLCGDVMLGRGIDQILPYSNNPVLYEPYVTDAREYVALAEDKNGKIKYPVSFDYIWGDALSIFNALHPEIKIINLETAITKSDAYWPDKEIHYRMHPKNIDILTTAKIDICALANNHILDWGPVGLKETMEALKNVHIQFAGAGNNDTEAMKPAIFQLTKNKRILFFSIGFASSGIPFDWQARVTKSGLYYFDECNDKAISEIINNIEKHATQEDFIILSVHWGSNWGYDVAHALRHFAHRLIDDVKIDVLYGHSSHHPRPIEIYHGKLILYGCGDFINDYEGIAGYEEYRGDLTLMYFLYFDKTTHTFEKLKLIPMKLKQFRLHHASKKDAEWLCMILQRYAIDHLKFELVGNEIIVT